MGSTAIGAQTRRSDAPRSMSRSAKAREPSLDRQEIKDCLSEAGVGVDIIVGGARNDCGAVGCHPFASPAAISLAAPQQLEEACRMADADELCAAIIEARAGTQTGTGEIAVS